VLSLANVRANIFDIYRNACDELNEDIVVNEDNITPKIVKDVSSFFYDLTLCRYAVNTKNDNLKKKTLRYLRRTTVDSIPEIILAVQSLFGDRDNPKHLSLYALRSYKIEVKIIISLLKKLQKNSISKEIVEMYKNYEEDLCSDSII